MEKRIVDKIVALCEETEKFVEWPEYPDIGEMLDYFKRIKRLCLQESLG